jgi:hypothetical protein
MAQGFLGIAFYGFTHSSSFFCWEVFSIQPLLLVLQAYSTQVQQKRGNPRLYHLFILGFKTYGKKGT